jgi:anaerobic nitric oxide reductase transcription regulator
VRLDASARRALETYPWSGNVRELENLLSRVVLRTAAGSARGEAVVIRAEHLGADFGAGGGHADASAPATLPDAPSVVVPPGRTLREAVEDYERAAIRRALSDHGGSWAAAARALGMHRSNLHHLATRLGLRLRDGES